MLSWEYLMIIFLKSASNSGVAMLEPFVELKPNDYSFSCNSK